MLKVLKRRSQGPPRENRKGAILVLAVFFIAGILTFVGMSVDLGMVNVTKSRMQSCADACALGAAQEIGAAMREAGQTGNVTNVHVYAETRAIAMAKDIATRNGFYLEDSDIDFGRRSYNGQKFVVDWSGSPYNAVKVTVRKDGSDLTRGDGRLKLMFAPVFGDKTKSLKTKAAAYIEARDIVTVLDYSGSMNFDSLPFETTLDKDDVEDNLDDIWDELVASGAYYSNESGTVKFPTTGWGKINSYAGTHKESSSSETIFNYLELGGDDEKVRFYDYDNYSGYMGKLGPGTYNLNNMSGWDDDINSFKVPDGFTVTLWDFEDEGGWQFGPKTSDVSSMGSKNNDAEWIVITKTGSTNAYSPYPQEGRYSNGNFKGKPNASESEDLWRDYIRWVIAESNDGSSSLLRIDSSHDYRYDFGYRTLMMYMLLEERYNNESEDLWRVSAYPYKAVKDGMTQFTDFLTDLQFGDTLGLVDYATTARKQNKISASDVSQPNNVTNVDLGSNTYMTTDYSKIETIQLHHQASHYSGATNIGDGVKKAREILANEGRVGARWQMLVMTDGVVNRPSSLPGNLPSGWDNFDWSQTDWDQDGTPNYTASDLGNSYVSQKKYLLYEAKKAVEAGITVHTMAVGNGADTALMHAIAAMGNGVYIEIPGNTTAAEMTQKLEEKFNVLAGNVPPAKLLFETD